MAKLIFICVILTNVLIVYCDFTFSYFGDSGTQSTEERDTNIKTCTKTLSTCAVEWAPNDIKGEKGLRGIDGPSGLKGSQGVPGNILYKSMDNIKEQLDPENNVSLEASIVLNRGDAGEQGSPGELGHQGPTGPKGSRGEPGLNGSSGTKGEKGEQGKDYIFPKGLSIAGPVGPPGIPGVAGSCPCLAIEEGDSTSENSVGAGTKANPSKGLCNDMEEDSETKEYYIGPRENPIRVECKRQADSNILLTCIPPGSEKSFTKNATKSKPFWLSTTTERFTVESIYGVSTEQLSWIHQKSDLAYQVLTYTIEYGDFNKAPEKPHMKLLSFKDFVFGSDPSETTPITYSSELQEKNEVLHRVSHSVKISPEVVKRLPVIDILTHFTDNTLSVIVKHEELCFY